MFRVLKSPSAAERISGAIAFIKSFPAATELLIVGASRDAADDFIRGFACASTPSATFGLHRFSLMQFASRLAITKLSANGIAPSSTIGAEALAIRVAYGAAANRELTYFEPVSKCPGFVHATAATIGDLRAAGIASNALVVLEESGPDLSALLERFRDEMEEASIAVRTLILQAALEEVRAGAELAKHPILLLDVSVHSAIERSFLMALAACSTEILITCPAGDLRTISNLAKVPSVEEFPTEAKPLDSSLTRVRTFLFSEATPPEGKPDDHVVFFSAPGEERESVEIARRILMESEKGVPLRSHGDIAEIDRSVHRLDRNGTRAVWHSCLLFSWKPAARSCGPGFFGAARVRSRGFVGISLCGISKATARRRRVAYQRGVRHCA